MDDSILLFASIYMAVVSILAAGLVLYDKRAKFMVGLPVMIAVQVAALAMFAAVAFGETITTDTRIQ